jgi:hypothetical protein
MHQGHNIPWELVASNSEFKEDNKSFTPATTGLFSTNRPNGSKEIKHFISRFVRAIRLFSETERAKYPIREKIKLISEGNIFSDELLKKYPEYLNKENQRIENWVWRAKRKLYDTGDGDLADVVKILLHENEIETLLSMANHPDIPLSLLHELGWGHSFGFSRVKESAVRAYMFFNSAEATGILEDGRYARSHFYTELLRELRNSMDYPAQQVPHQEFFNSIMDGSAQGGRDGISENPGKNIYVHHWQNRALLQEYMKTLFSLMYRYDLIMRECGSEPDWELDIGRCYPVNKVVRIEQKWVASNG